MITFNSEKYFESELHIFQPVVERREPYIDIYLRLKLIVREDEHHDLSDPGALIICNADGKPIQFVVLEEGCDSEYRFTDLEKDQLWRFVEQERLLEQIR